MHHGECVGCDMFGRIDEQGLCADCAKQLERDLIRERAWAYSVSAFGLSDTPREDLRRQVTRKFGKDMELIAPSRPAKPKRRRRHNRKRK